MTDAKLVNLERTITKQDWINIVSWINVRWNTGWTDKDIKSLYNDFKTFPTDLVWYSLELYYKNKNEFFNPSKFIAVFHESWLRLEQEVEQSNQLEGSSDYFKKNEGGLIEYLELNGYDSFAHAVYDSMMQRFKKGGALNHEDPNNWDFDEPWESAKSKFLNWFPTHKPLEQLKAKRENNGE